jgi:hypothetical protein
MFKHIKSNQQVGVESRIYVTKVIVNIRKLASPITRINAGTFPAAFNEQPIKVSVSYSELEVPGGGSLHFAPDTHLFRNG